MTVMGSRANGIEKATGVAWSDWTAWLTAQRAQEREHGTIARLAEQRLRELGISRHATTGEQLNTGWWAQAIAVDFEHDHGMRRPGQTARAGFAVTVTKTLPGTIDDALAAWLAVAGDVDAVAGRRLSGEPAVTRTEKWRYWRVGFADGSRVSVDITARKVAQGAPPKAALSVNHGGLESPEAGEPVRAWWKALLGRVGAAV